MKNHSILTIVFLILPLNFWGQGEGNNWYFGTYAGITFNTSPPSLLNDGQLSTSEGCASVSSKDGSLVFYTDGSTVYDINHNVMPNGTGLFGNPSSTQSSVVCPKPGTYNYSLRRFNAYYIITIEVSNGTSAGGNNGGVRYTEVDMTTNGGLGSVVSSRKNIHLFGTTTIEGANIAKHANGCDYWIIGKEVGTTNIRSYLITSSGVNNTPIISTALSIGAAHVGSIKISSNSKLVCIVNNSTPSVEVYDFDNSTGILTQKFNDNMPFISGYRAYSSEFSPNNNILYTATLNNPTIYQYDLTSSNNSTFVTSRTAIGTTSNTIGYRICALQIAPDGKIYAALQGANRLGAIQNPNILGIGCGYNDNELSIVGNNTNGTAMNVVLGLPAFPSFFIFPNEVQYESANYSVNQYFCNSDSITFRISDTNSVQSVDWYLSPINSPYPSSPSAVTNEYKIPPPASGDYKVLSVVNYACFVDSIIDTISVNALPIASLGADIDSCTNATVSIDATSSTGNSYLWNDGSTSAINSFASTGQYSIKVTDALGCSNYDTVSIAIHEVPNASFTTSSVCLNNQSEFNNQSSISVGSIVSNQWNFGDNNSSTDLNPSNLYANDGSYNVQLIVTSNNNCKDTSVTNHIVLPIPNTNAGFDTTLNCQIDSVILDGSFSSNGPTFDFQWTTMTGNFTSNTTNDSVVIDKNGWYYLTVTNNINNCFTNDSVFVAIDTLAPNFSIGLDSILTCTNPSIVLNALNNQSGNFIYSWTTDTGNIQSGGNTLSPQVNEAGAYYLDVLNTTNQCLSNDSLRINIDTIKPIAISGSDTLINCTFPSIYLSGTGSSNGNYSYLWVTNSGNILNGNTTLFPEINEPGIYTLTVTNDFNGCSTTDQTNVSQNDSAFANILFNQSADSIFSIYSFDENQITYTGNNGPVQWMIDNADLSNDSIINFSFEESGNHQIILELVNSNNGCITYDTTNIIVTHRLIIPSVLSPNADGYNDVFIIRALENYDDNSISIFNRWGESVFNASPYLNDWDGQVNSSNILMGSQVVDGTYFYLLNLSVNGENLIYKGFIEVKRK